MNDWKYFSCDVDMCLTNYGDFNPQESYENYYDAILFRIDSSGIMQQFGVDTHDWTGVGQKQI